MSILQTFLGKISRVPLALIPSDAVIPILRGPLRGKKWVKGAGTNACWVGTYEVAHLREFAEAIQPGATVYDVGANVGIYTLLASTTAGAQGKVYSFEPMERNLRYLRRHIELNQASNCVVTQSAVSDTNESRRFSAAGWDFSMGRLAENGEKVVPCVTLDSFVYGETKAQPPNVMKIDVESAELDVLKGSERMLTEYHPRIFLEIHGTQLHAECLHFLKALGYEVQEGYGRLTANWKSPR